MLKSSAETTFHKEKQKFRSAVMFGTKLQRPTNILSNRDREIRYNNTLASFLLEKKAKEHCIY